MPTVRGRRVRAGMATRATRASLADLENPRFMAALPVIPIPEPSEVVKANTSDH